MAAIVRTQAGPIEPNRRIAERRQSGRRPHADVQRKTFSIGGAGVPTANDYNEGIDRNRGRLRGVALTRHRIFSTPFVKVYPTYVQKAERKGRTQNEVDRIICWLTGYDQAGLRRQMELQNDFEVFIAQAPAMHPNRALIKGVVCGIRVEEIADPLIQKIRYMDKLIVELAKGRPMEKILRQEASVPHDGE